MNEPRWSHGAVVLDGEVWVTGGMDDDHNALATVEVYSPVTDSWRSSEPMTVPRYGHGCGVVGGRLVVAGGFTDTGNGNGNLRTVDAFTGTEWIALPPMEKKPWDPTACVDGRGRLVVFGGLPAYIVQVLTHSDDRGYEWAMRSRAPRAWEQCGRNAATAVVVGGKILVIGGTSRRGSPFSVMQYDVDADEWSLAPPLPPEYGKHRSGAFRYYKAVELGEPGEGRVLVMHRDRFMLRRADGEWDRAPASMWMREFPMAGESGFLAVRVRRGLPGPRVKGRRGVVGRSGKGNFLGSKSPPMSASRRPSSDNSRSERAGGIGAIASSSSSSSSSLPSMTPRLGCASVASLRSSRASSSRARR